MRSLLIKVVFTDRVYQKNLQRLLRELRQDRGESLSGYESFQQESFHKVFTVYIVISII